ncbi:MAG: aminoacyl-tRNA hydrolase [Neomegalonema sp.]|nr:aminoacyl-tRNA hydrolase [Neomegalonema sp.]
MGVRISPAITLDDDEIVERFTRASGPGGQNVNKVSTAVELRFNAMASPNLTERVKTRLARLAGRRMTSEGVIVLRAEDTRSQARNREAALARLVELIREAAAPPPKPRIATKPTKASQRRRLDAKARRGANKALRGRIDPKD